MLQTTKPVQKVVANFPFMEVWGEKRQRLERRGEKEEEERRGWGGGERRRI